MTAGSDSNPGYGTLTFTELVERELKSLSVTQEELQLLRSNRSGWKAELVIMKKRTEMQMTSSKARSYGLYVDVTAGTLTNEAYMAKLHGEKVWRVNAARFLQQIEARIQKLKAIDD